MRKTILIFLAGALCLSVTGQNSETRNVGDYDEIYISGWFDVELVSGNEGEILLEGKPSYLDDISTEVMGGKLTIKWERNTNFNLFSSWSTIRITIPVKEIEGVALSGSGSIEGRTKLVAENFSSRLSGSGKISLDVETQSLSAVISGSGDMHLSGKTDTLEAEVSGSGDIKAFELTANRVTATISGSADIKVHANESIKARISGSGDVKYTGNATKVNSQISGSGSVTKSNSF